MKRKKIIDKYLCLPDKLEAFQDKFVDTNTFKVQNILLFQSRILGLTSYFKGSNERMMPKYIKSEDFKIEECPMSNFQFSKYEEARVEERKQGKKASKQRKKGDAYLLKLVQLIEFFLDYFVILFFQVQIRIIL